MADELITALAKAQAEFLPIAKSHKADAGKYTYTYANLADTLAAVVPALNKHGIVLLQPMQWTASGVELQTVLLGHGERLSACLPLYLDGLPAQEAGKLMSYMRRYLVTSFLGLAADDDDAAANTPVKYRADGAEAAYKPRERTYVAERGEPASNPSAGPGRPSTEKQRKWANGLIKDLGWSPVEAAEVFTLLVQTDGLDTMSTAQASKVIDELTAIKKRERVVAWDDDGKPSIATVGELVADGTEPW